MEQKHYMDIERFRDSFSKGFSTGDLVVVQEKIDGANFSIRYNEFTDSVDAFSRKTALSSNNTLRGAWEWSQRPQVLEAVRTYLPSEYILFGEWLVPHTVRYPSNCYHKAYFYDIYDTDSRQWLPQKAVEKIVHLMGLTYVPTFYSGPFISWDHINSMVGMTRLGGEMGEGVVVKNQTRLNDPNTRLPFYTKVVSEKFAEVHDVKPHIIDPEKLAKQSASEALVATVVTEARIRKLVLKMVDEELIPSDWGPTDMGIIAKNLGKAVYYDCVKEEPEIVEKVDNFGRIANAQSMKIVKNILLLEQ